jgi:hemerythrin-like domain-containing protein
MHEGLFHSVTRVIAADPATLYGLISDVTRTGEWSPETRSARWLGGATGPALGVRFRGRNRWGLTAWSRTCVVEEAEPGKKFAFRTLPKAGVPDSTRWCYEFTEVAAGTRVTESYEIVDALPRWIQKYAVARLLPHHFDMRPHMAETLARLEFAAGLYPGQAAAPPGPIDLIGMYSMHFALRRDLADFTAAVTRTPVSDRDAWAALRDRWDRFAEILHKHHTAEDDILWPMLRDRVAAAGDTDGVRTLDAMEAEHAGIDPMLTALRDGFRTLAAGATEADRAAQANRLGATVALLGAHLGHEERDAMALVQKHLTRADWDAAERGFRAAYGPKDLAFVVPWGMKGQSPIARRRALAPGGLPLKVLAALTRPAFRRGERKAFRHVA